MILIVCNGIFLIVWGTICIIATPTRRLPPQSKTIINHHIDFVASDTEIIPNNFLFRRPK